MAGGTFIAQNKIRPGAYINYVAIKNSSTIPESDSGVVFLKDSQIAPIWGGGGLIEITREDLLRGGITKKLGYTEADNEYYVFREILRNAQSVLLRVTGGVVAKGATNKIEAIQPGTAGNSIIVSYEGGVVSTSFRGKVVDSQQATTVGDFVSTGFIKFVEAAGTALSTLLASPVTLTGGTSGTLQDPMPIDRLNVLLVNEVTAPVVVLAKDYRETQGIKIQVVAGGTGAVTPDYEGVIRVKNEYHYPIEAPTAELGRAYVAGLTSASGPAQSNTYHQLPEGATLTTVLSHADIQTAIQTGFLVLSYRRTGVAVIESDINSLTTFSTTKKYEFSKNRVLRVLDAIATTVANIFEEQYIGKVTNNEIGRSLLGGQISKYLASLQDIDAIQNFEADTDVEVLRGDSIDSVVVNVYIQPLDSMEKLYMTIYVN